MLSWARFDSLERGGIQPTEDLGPRYVIVVTRIGDGQGPSSVREDLYPLADGGPLVFAAPGQIFSHPTFGGRYVVPGGWASVDGLGPIPDLLRDAGVPIPQVAPTPSPPTPTSAPTSADVAPPTAPATTVAPTVGASATGASGPDVVTVLFLAGVVGAIAFLLLRRRGPRGEV
jgi:hypothetical protein